MGLTHPTRCPHAALRPAAAFTPGAGRLALLAGVLALAWPAVSQVAADGENWRCWHDLRIHIICVQEAPAASAQPLPEASAAGTEGTAVAKNDPAPRIGFIHIPMHAPSFEMDRVEMLARSVVCFKRTACRVHFAPKPPAPEELRAMELRIQQQRLDAHAFD